MCVASDQSNLQVKKPRFYTKYLSKSKLMIKKVRVAVDASENEKIKALISSLQA